MVKPDHLTLDSLMSRKGYTGEVGHSSTAAVQRSTAACSAAQHSTAQHKQTERQHSTAEGSRTHESKVQHNKLSTA
jgi:hypothetical protein